MHTLDIIVNGENAYPELVAKEATGKLIRDTTGDMLISVAGLPNGTDEGRAAVIFRVDLPDGTTVLVQTTMRLFLNAAHVFDTIYGSLADG